MINFIRSQFQATSTKRVLKRLGFALNTKLLIVHADDMGLSHSSNMACVQAMESGFVNSGSVMMPCPFANEMIAYAKLNPSKDIGIHLTLTSEWNGYKWPPLIGNKVPSLINSNGFFFESREELEMRASLSEVEQEMRAQIELALSKGMNPTHLDCHMFSGIVNPEFLKIYIKLGREYGMPVLLNRAKIKKWFRYDVDPYVTEQEVMVSRLFIATPRLVKKGFPNYYRHVLQSLSPGLNCLLVHPAFDDKEMKLITKGSTDYNSAWRQADFDFFTSDECRSIIHKSGIHLITWKQIKEIYYNQS